MGAIEKPSLYPLLFLLTQRDIYDCWFLLPLQKNIA